MCFWKAPEKYITGAALDRAGLSYGAANPPGTAATTGLLYQRQMIDDGDCEASGGIKIGRGNRSTRRKPAPAPLCPQQISHDQTRARTRAAAVVSQRLTTWDLSIYLSIYLSMALQPFVGLGRSVSFLILYTVGRTPWTWEQSVASPLPTHRTTRTYNKRTQTSMPRVGFEPTSPAFERAKTIWSVSIKN
jgi:hypothetical protein